MHTKTSSNLTEIALDIQFNAAVLAIDARRGFEDMHYQK
jgi:hypothetical protein